MTCNIHLLEIRFIIFSMKTCSTCGHLLITQRLYVNYANFHSWFVFERILIGILARRYILQGLLRFSSVTSPKRKKRTCKEKVVTRFMAKRASNDAYRLNVYSLAQFHTQTQCYLKNCYRTCVMETRAGRETF